MKKSTMVLLLIFNGLILSQFNARAAVCPTPLPIQYENIKAGNKFVAYFTSWDTYNAKYQIENIEAVADKLTHIIYAFIKPDDKKGRCVMHDPWGDIGALHGYKKEVGGNFAKLIEFKKKFPHIKILLSIGGGTYTKNFDKIAESRKKLETLAQSSVDMLDFYLHDYQNPDTKKQGTIRFDYDGLFDGLDIDWEWYPGKVTKEKADAFQFFMHEVKRLIDLREKQTNKKSVLTAALQAAPSVYKNLDLVEIAKDIDWFHLMAYDFFGPNNEKVGFNAPLCSKWSVYSIDGALHRIMQQGLSPEKIVLGLPSYGYLYEKTDGHKRSFEKTANTKAISYSVIKEKYLHNSSYIPQWHDLEQVFSLYNKLDRKFISYDGIESIEHKVAFAQSNRLQGVMLWKLSGDDSNHTLVRTIANKLQSP